MTRFCHQVLPNWLRSTTYDTWHNNAAITLAIIVLYRLRDLTKGDVDCIKNDWLTDNGQHVDAHRNAKPCILYRYLEHEKLSHYREAKINLLRPSMVFMLIHTQDPLTLKDALPPFQDSTHVFLPINDCRVPNVPEGGSHWSLLLISLLDGIAFHYDSLTPTNLNSAAVACNQMSRILNRGPLRFVNLHDSPQQANGSDCGIFVCLIMKHLLVKRLLLRDANEKVTMSMRGKDIDATRGRKEMLTLINEFRKEGKRSPSASRSGHRSASPFHRPSSSASPPRVGD
ncbi:MAG: hypothetical protein M1831_000774 [Alyxoria varia]|nr:MAG: hypothetical protein M1831_000774 [Alyxoria varia]